MRLAPWLVTISLVVVSGCAGEKLDCGEGTHEEDNSCVPDEESDTDTDTDTDTGQVRAEKAQERLSQSHFH